MSTGRPSARHPVASLIAANLLYAAAFPTSVVALRSFSPVTLTGLRFLVAAAALAPLALPVLRRSDRRQLLHLTAISVVGLWGQMVLIYLGINRSGGAVAAIIVGLEPVLIALWAALLLSERFGARRAAGLAVGLLGSVLVAGIGSKGGSSPTALVLLLGTGIAFSWFTVSSKPYLGRCSPLELTGAISVLGAGFAVLPTIIDATIGHGWGSPGWRGWAAVAYLGIGNSVLGYGLWNRALRSLPAAAVGASLYAQPILGAGLSWIALREPLPATFLPGAVLVLLGVWIATRRPAALASHLS